MAPHHDLNPADRLQLRPSHDRGNEGIGQLAKATASVAPDVMNSTGKALVLGNAIDETVPVKQDGVEMLRESADRAVVKVVDVAGRFREVTLVQVTRHAGASRRALA
jgi:hypothetical protein